MSIAYILTDTSVTVLVALTPKVIDSKHPNFARIVDLLKNPATTEVDIVPLLDIPQAIRDFTGGQVYVKNGKLYYEGCEVRTSLGAKIMQFIRAGQPELAEPLKAFLANVQQNPDPRAGQDLFDWVQASGLPITGDGYVLAWKAVTMEYRSLHCPLDARFDHRIGKIVEQQRDECDADPTRTCSSGLHFCEATYLKSYAGGGARIVVLKIHPKDVVSFPTDYHLRKGRACRYEVVGELPYDKISTYYPQGSLVYRGFDKVAPTAAPAPAKPKLEVVVGGVYRRRDGKAVVIKEVVVGIAGDHNGERYWAEGGAQDKRYKLPGDLIEKIEFPLTHEDFFPGDRWVQRNGNIVTIRDVRSVALSFEGNAVPGGLFSDTGRRRQGDDLSPEDLVFNLDFKRDRRKKFAEFFAVGQVWMQRNGVETKITSIDPAAKFPIVTNRGGNYHPGVGQAFYHAPGDGISSIDLVKLVRDEG